MPRLTGNTYGFHIARIDAPVLLALDLGGGVQLWAAKIVSLLESGEPVIGRIGADPMVSTGYVFQATSSAEDVGALAHGKWTWPIGPHAIVGLGSIAASADVAANAGDGWVTMHSAVWTSVGGTSVSVQWLLVAAVTVGGKARLVVSGGVYGAGEQVGPEMSFDALPSAPVGGFWPVPLPAASPAVEYTIAIQAQAVGVGASVVMNAASSPATSGARLAEVEYH